METILINRKGMKTIINKKDFKQGIDDIWSDEPVIVPKPVIEEKIEVKEEEEPEEEVVVVEEEDDQEETRKKRLKKKNNGGY